MVGSTHKTKFRLWYSACYCSPRRSDCFDHSSTVIAQRIVRRSPGCAQAGVSVHQVQVPDRLRNTARVESEAAPSPSLLDPGGAISWVAFARENDRGDPAGIRTPVAALKGRCPRPLDDRATTERVPRTLVF